MLHELIPEAGEYFAELVEGWFGEILRYGSMGGLAFIEGGMGATLANKLSNGLVGLGYQWKYGNPNPDFMPLRDHELQAIVNHSPQILNMTPAKARRVRTELLDRIVAFPDLAKRFERTLRYFIHGDVDSALRHPDARLVIFSACINDMDTLRQAYHDFKLEPLSGRRVMPQSKCKIIKPSVIYKYGIEGMAKNVRDIVNYPRRRPKGLFCLATNITLATGVTLAVNFYFPSLSEQMSKLLEEELDYHVKGILNILALGFEAAIASSVGQMLGNKISDVFYKLKRGHHDPDKMALDAGEIAQIVSNSPAELQMTAERAQVIHDSIVQHIDLFPQDEPRFKHGLRLYNRGKIEATLKDPDIGIKLVQGLALSNTEKSRLFHRYGLAMPNFSMVAGDRTPRGSIDEAKDFEYKGQHETVIDLATDFQALQHQSEMQQVLLRQYTQDLEHSQHRVRRLENELRESKERGDRHHAVIQMSSLPATGVVDSALSSAASQVDTTVAVGVDLAQVEISDRHSFQRFSRGRNSLKAVRDSRKHHRLRESPSHQAGVKRSSSYPTFASL